MSQYNNLPHVLTRPMECSATREFRANKSGTNKVAIWTSVRARPFGFGMKVEAVGEAEWERNSQKVPQEGGGCQLYV